MTTPSPSSLHHLDAEELSVQREMTLGEHLFVIRRYVWIILCLAVGGAAIAGGWSLMRTPLYEATASVVIDREGPGLFDRDRESLYDSSPEYLQTHFELLKSHEVLRRTADLLKLWEQPEYQVKSRFARLIDELRQRVYEMFGGDGSLTSAHDKATEEDGAQHSELGQFRRHILVSPVRGSRVVHITVQSHDARFAAKAANTLAAVYIDNVMELKAGTKEKASKWFSTHLEELRRKVEESEYNLYSYRSKYGLMDAHERQMVATQQFSELNSEMVKAEMKRADALARYQQIASLIHHQAPHKNETAIREGDEAAGLAEATEILHSPLIQVLRTEEIKASARAAELADKYGPLHPKMMHARSELDDLRQRIQKEMQKIYSSIKHEYETIVARVKMIREAVERHKEEKMKLEQHEVEHAILDREAQSNRQLYDTFLRQMKETNLTSGMLMSNIYLADPAVASTAPVQPRMKLNILLGLIAGLLGGIGLAFMMDYRDHSFKSSDEIERYLPSLPLLGVVPIQLNGSRKLLGIITLHSNGHGGWHPTLLTDGNGSGPMMDPWISAESYRTIRTNILLPSTARPFMSLLITSPGEREGKTTLAVNLAFAMVQLEGLRIVLINADLRKPSSRRFFGEQAEASRGLAHYLMSQATVADILNPTHIPNLFVIPPGMVPPNSSELLHSKRMSDLLTQLTESGFQVIVDAPPVLPVADALILSTQTEGVVLVISERETDRDACRVAINRITGCGGKLLGVILQKSHSSQAFNAGQRYSAMAT